MSSRPELRLDFIDHKAAKYAVEHWHYSHSLSACKKVSIGVWEEGDFIGAVIFSVGANPNLYRPWEGFVGRYEVAELTRVALRYHISPVSKIVSIALKLLKKVNPGLRLVLSYADQRQGHIGAIYQAMNWIYTGEIRGTPYYLLNGRWIHQRQLGSLLKKVNGGKIKGVRLPKRPMSKKYRYLMPLDAAMRAQILPLAKPYPKGVRSDTNDTPAAQAGEGGVTPTRTLQECEEICQPHA
jgi:hypothetical protein